MRSAGYDSGFHLTQDGDILGVSLHGDYCTEHEIGVSELKEALGVPSRFEKGLVDRVNTCLPPVFRFETYTLPNGTPAAWLLGADQRSSHLLDNLTPNQADRLPSILAQKAAFRVLISIDSPHCASKAELKKIEERANFAAAWDSHGFIIHVRKLANVNRLKALADAFNKNDIAFGGALIKNDPAHIGKVGGLTFVRASKIAPEAAAAVLSADERRVRLHAAADQVLPDLKDHLRRAGKQWFALSPQWNDASDEAKGVKFFLNPQEQNKYHSGAYTVDELLEWAKEKGPILRDLVLEDQAKRHRPALDKLSRALEKGRVQAPRFSTVRTPHANSPFAINVSYAYVSQPRKNQTRLKEGQYTLETLLAMDPTLTTDQPRRRPRQK